jgi:hypothetical protein
MLYIYAFYSIKIPRWKGYTLKQVKFVIEKAFHKYLDQKGAPRHQATKIEDLGPHWKECMYRLILF